MSEKTEKPSIRIHNAALAEVDGEMILRGVIDPDSLDCLLVANYQRGVLATRKIESLVEAFKVGKGEVPDVDLGMRGERYRVQNDVHYLQDDVYVIDGLQRITAAMQLLRGGEMRPTLGASIHFNTKEQWERERFKKLNSSAFRSKVSVNVLLRNLRHDYPVIEMLIRLCDDKSFVLGDKVCWNQNMKRGELLPALLFLRVIGACHSHLGPGRSTSTPDQIAGGLQKIMDKIGKNILRDNVRTFFDTIDMCWNLRSVALKDVTPFIKGTFLDALATVLSQHETFWREHRLFVERPLMMKIKGFPVQDPSVRGLASAGGAARNMLINLMVSHINSGKRTKRLVARDHADTSEEDGHQNELATELVESSAASS